MLEFQLDERTGVVMVIIKDARSRTELHRVAAHSILRLGEALTPTQDGPQALVDLTA